MAEKSPDNGPFIRLPEELRIHILKLSPDLTCLWNLVQASPAMSGVLGRYPTEILETVLDRTVPGPILRIMRAVLAVRLSYFPPSLDAGRGIGNLDPSITAAWGHSPPDPGQAAEAMRSFLATAKILHLWCQVTLGHLIRKSLELRPSTFARFPTSSEQEGYSILALLQQAEAESLPYQPLVTGPPSPMEEWRMLNAFWLMRFFLELRDAGARGCLDQSWPQQHCDILLSSSVGYFFELHDSLQQQLLTVHDFLSSTSGATKMGVMPCAETPSFTIGEDRSGWPMDWPWSNTAWWFHRHMTHPEYMAPPLLGSFETYRKYGFAIWDDQRLIDLGFLRRGSIRRDYHFYCFRWRSIVTEEELP